MKLRLHLVIAAGLLATALVVAGCGGKKTQKVEAGKKNGPVAGPIAPINAPSPTAAAPGKPGQPTKPVAPLPAAKIAPKDLLKAVSASYASMKSVKMEGRQRVQVAYDGKVVRESPYDKFSMLFKRPNKLVYSSGGSQEYCDGNVVYTYAAKPNQYLKSKSGKQFVAALGRSKPGVGTIGLLAGVSYQKTIASIQDAEDAKIGGKDAYKLTLKLKNQKGAPKDATAVQTLWITKDDLIVRKNELVMTMHPTPPKGYKGKVPKTVRSVVTGELTLVVVNPRIPNSTFTFRPPKGSKAFEPPKPPKQVDVTGKQAPDFPYKASDGSSQKISALQGKPVVLLIWGLPMCEKQLPAMQSIYDKNKDTAEILILNVNEKTDKVLEHLKKKGYTFPTVFATEEMAKVAAEQYGVRAIPTTVVIDAQGTVRLVAPGEISEKQVGEVLAKLAP